MYFEHRGRLAILKAAADYLVAGGPVDASDPAEIRVDVRLADLPQTFLRGVDWLKAQPRYWLYPLFWQNFLWGWGGLLPDAHRDLVIADVAAASGLDAAEAEVALQALDRLFPVATQWHHHFSNADYQFVILTPAPFQGLGAFHQLRRSGQAEYRTYVATGQYTAADFAAAQPRPWLSWRALIHDWRSSLNRYHVTVDIFIDFDEAAPLPADALVVEAQAREFGLEVQGILSSMDARNRIRKALLDRGRQVENVEVRVEDVADPRMDMKTG